MELWDVIDNNGNKTGKTVLRGHRCLSKGEFHLVVHIWIIDDNNRILIQRRSDNRHLMPGEWAATGGAVISGEDTIQAARRELSEELGIYLNTNDFNLLKRIKRKNSFVDVWLVKVNLEIDQLKLQEDEVSEVKWVDKATLKMMIEKGEFHNYGEDYNNFIFSIIK